jgi:hypothetical protein
VRRSRRRSPQLASVLLVALAAEWGGTAGCRRREEPPRPGGLETVDVAPQPDAAASLEGDVVERRPVEPAGGVAGVLPEGFPRDVPVPAPSSLVDVGDRAVTFEIASAPAAAEAAYRRRLTAAGFALGADGAWRRGPRALRFGVEPAHGVARLRLELVD